MNQRVVGWVRGVTGAGLTAGVLLIALGVAEQSASVPLIAVVLAIGLAASAVRSTLRAQLDSPAFSAYLAAVPLGPLVAGVVMLLFLGATPGELQTLGGIVGLLALLNHLLRPVYALGFALVSRLSSALA